MAFNCMNINSSFLKMLDFGKSGDSLSGFTDFSKEGVLFKEQFAKMFGGSQLKTPDSKKGNSVFDKLISFVSKELKGLEGADFLKKLKEAFMMISNNGLKKLTIDEQGLDAFKELLAEAGFDIDQTTELIDGLKLVMSEEGENIFIGDLMDKFAALEIEPANRGGKVEDEDDASMLPLSAIPFIESIMVSLGIPSEVRNSILSDAKIDTGIDLNVLIKNLKEFEQKSFAAGTYFKTDINDDNVAKLMAQINLGEKSKAFYDGKLSLQDFISVLEDKMKEVLSPGNTKDTETAFINPAKAIKSKMDLTNSMVQTDLNAAEVKAEGDKKLDDLVNNLFQSINKEKNNNEKIVNVPLNKFDNKDIEKLFPFHVKGENGKDVQIEVKSELEEKFAKFIVKLASDMNGKNDSESRNPFQQDRQKSTAFKMPDSSQLTNGEGKILNSVRYLSSAKNEATRTLPSYVTNQIGRSIVRAVNQGQSEIKIQLKPPELGRMMITIEEMGNGMKVSVVAENQNARDILLSNSNNLKAALASSGVNLENFDVDMGSDFNRSMADAKNQAGYSKNKRGQKTKEIDGESTGVDNLSLVREQHLTHDGVLYYVA
jgi:flagellar hook-length control protein FliK